MNVYNFVPPKTIVNRTNPYNFKYWLTVAQHRKNKNIDLVIRAFDSYRRHNNDDKNLKLVIVGSEGPETVNIKKLVHNLKLGGDVQFLRNISQDNLTTIYRNSALTINASSIEGFGLPLIEACYYGKRIVATDISVYKELVSDVPTFSLKGDSLANLEAVIHSSLDSPYSPPVLNPELAESFITKKLANLIQQSLIKGT